MLANDPSSSAARAVLLSLGWSEGHFYELAQMLRREAVIAQESVPKKIPSGDVGNTSTAVASRNWMLPDGLTISYVRGVIIRRFRLRVIEPAIRMTQVSSVPTSERSAIIVPFLAVDRVCSAIEIPINSHGSISKIHYSVHRIVDGFAVATGTSVTSEDENGSRALIEAHARLEPGSRYFLRLWAEPNQIAPTIVCLPADSEGWEQETLDIEVTCAPQLPDPALLRPTDNYMIGLLHNADAADVGQCRNAIEKLFPASNVYARTISGPLSGLLQWASTMHMCCFINATTNTANVNIPDLASLLGRHGVCTVDVRTGRDDDVAFSGRLQEVSDACHYSAIGSYGTSGKYLKLTWRLNSEHRDTEDVVPTLRVLRQMIWPQERLPAAVIVAVLQNNIDALSDFLRAVYRQNYPGEIRIVLVSDELTDAEFARAQTVVDGLTSDRPMHIDSTLLPPIENATENSPLNRGIAAVPGDMYIALNVDCLPNAQFVTAHVSEYLNSEADAVTGPSNIDLDFWSSPRDALSDLDRASAFGAMKLEDNLQLNAFVNCTIRNFSIRREVFERLGGFDAAFPGWENIELGYRLYLSGANIRFAPNAVSVNQSLLSPRRQRRDAASLDRLIERHPDIVDVARRWATKTIERVVQDAQHAPVQGPSVGRLQNRLRRARASIGPYLLRPEHQRPLRVVSHRWHAPHQYEIHKLPYQFTLLTGTGTGFTNDWATPERPLRANVQLLPADRFDRNDYDIAILHLDENVLCPHMSNGVLGPDWGATFQWFMANVDLPTIAVCHGTPPFYGQYAADPSQIEQFEIIEDERDRLVAALRDITVICNSYQAAAEWGFLKSRVIWHGMDPQEFPPGTHELSVISHGLDQYRPHYRGAFLLKGVMDRLGPELEIATHHHRGPRPITPRDRLFSERSFRSWVDHLRKFKAYLNTTLRSPMPRSRTEAMMCGVIPVTCPNHDVDQFISHGINGYIAGDVEEIADILRFICSNYSRVEPVARRARETALRVFNHDRFLAEWSILTQKLAQGRL